ERLPEVVEGALVLSWHHPRFTETLVKLKQKGTAFVLVDEHSADVEVASVTADNYAGGMMVGHALIDLGHRTLGFIGNLSAGTVRARLEGLRDAAGDRGLPFPRSRV